MRFLRYILVGYAFLAIFFGGKTFASELPFTDVNPSENYYNAIKNLYGKGIITDTSDHLFRPKETIARDAFTSLVLGASCQSCTIPTTEDILRFRVAPFTDVLKKNRYFYCISRSKLEDIVQGYMIDPNTGTVECQNNMTSTSTLFCPTNTITRIEAVAMLLREANLWDDTRNLNISRTLTIADVSDYWYGYAREGLEVGLIQMSTGSKIFPDDPITRGEFAIMAEKTLRMNQCTTIAETLAVRIGINENNGIFDLEGITENDELSYMWRFYNLSTDENFERSGKNLTGVTLGTGSWVITLNISDTAGNIGTSVQNVTVGSENNQVTASIWVSTLTPFVGEEVRFEATITGGTPPYESLWTFSDGSQSLEKTLSHTFDSAGFFPITYMVRDQNGETSISQIVIHVLPLEDADGDGVIDTEDRCPRVVGIEENLGCPLLPGDTENDQLGRTIDWYEDGLDTLTSVNFCLANQSGNNPIIIGNVACTSCPCAFSIEYTNALEPCDIIFPVILSKDRNTIYSRGNTYQIQ